MSDLEMAGAGFAAQTKAASSQGWALAPGERLLWQGRPRAGLVFTRKHLFTLIRGLFALGLFLYILSRLNFGLAPYLDIQIIVFALFFLSIPISMGQSAYARKISRYALTDRRALVAMDMPLFGQSLLSLPIGPQTPLEISRGRLWTILLPGPERQRRGLQVVPKPAGFERISDGPAVLALIEAVQRGNPPPGRE